VWVRLSVERDGNVLANSVYEILSGVDLDRASRDAWRRAIRAQTDRDLTRMSSEEKLDALWGAILRIDRP
jgi:hypothetical protein